jgi:hypothetical protein
MNGQRQDHGNRTGERGSQTGCGAARQHTFQGQGQIATWQYWASENKELKWPGGKSWTQESRCSRWSTLFYSL